MPRPTAAQRKRHERVDAALRERALAYPGAHEDFPWGERVVKVGPKVFVFMGKTDDPEAAEGVRLGVKLPESREEALTFPWCSPTRYGLGRHGWVSVAVPFDVDPPLDVLADWIDESYRAVAPKRLVAELDARL